MDIYLYIYMSIHYLQKKTFDQQVFVCLHSRNAIPHLARSIPLRLDDICINILPMCYRQHQLPTDEEEFLIHSQSLNSIGRIKKTS